MPIRFTSSRVSPSDRWNSTARGDASRPSGQGRVRCTTFISEDYTLARILVFIGRRLGGDNGDQLGKGESIPPRDAEYMTGSAAQGGGYAKGVQKASREGGRLARARSRPLQSRLGPGPHGGQCKFPLVAANCRWQALHLKTRRHGYRIGSVRGSGVVIRIIGAIFDATIDVVLLLLVLIAMRRMTRCVCLSHF